VKKLLVDNITFLLCRGRGTTLLLTTVAGFYENDSSRPTIGVSKIRKFLNKY
jgi:hypothetical protein